jgi:hypothetical protein
MFVPAIILFLGWTNKAEAASAVHTREWPEIPSTARTIALTLIGNDNNGIHGATIAFENHRRLRQDHTVAPAFPSLPDPVLRGVIEVAWQSLTSTRQNAFSLLGKLTRTQQRLSSDLGFQQEEDNLMATQMWADDVLNVAWQVIMKAGRLVDEVDFLLPRLEQANDVPSEQMERMHMDELSGNESEKHNAAPGDEIENNEML